MSLNKRSARTTTALSNPNPVLADLVRIEHFDDRGESIYVEYQRRKDFLASIGSGNAANHDETIVGSMATSKLQAETKAA